MTSTSERKFFSGNTLQQAVLAAARHHGVDPSRVAYRLRDKKHGFVNIRRKVVIEVDPAAPEQVEATIEEAAPEREVAPPARREGGGPPPRPATQRNRGRDEAGAGMRWRGAEITLPDDGADDGDGETAAVDRSLEEIAELLDMDLDPVIRREGGRFEVELTGEDCETLLAEEAAALDAAEHLLPRLVRGLVGHASPCRLDSGGFRAGHEDELRELAEEVAEEVRRELQPRKLEPMSPADRRLIHMALAEDPAVRTESEGEGFLKRVKILPA